MTAIETLIAKDAIRDLVLRYARGVDRKDVTLLRTLYAADSWDAHGHHYDGPAEGYFAFLERQLPHMHIGAHHVCNHLISVEGERAEGEVYAIAWHLIPDDAGGLKHDIQSVRYIDSYIFEDGDWKFARRDVSFDMKIAFPADNAGPMPDAVDDLSYRELSFALFARGG